MTKLSRRLIVATPLGLLAGCLFNGGSGGEPPEPDPPAGPHEPPAGVSPLRAYVTGDPGTLMAFYVDPLTGVLTPIGEPVDAGGNPTQVVADPSGRFAYVASHLNRTVRSYALEADSGAPAFRSESLPVGDVRSVAVHPSGAFVYVTVEEADAVSQFTVDPLTGVLSDNGFVDVGAFPCHLVAHPAGRFVHVANRQADSIGVYEVEQTTGVLQELPGSLLTLTDDRVGPFALAVDPAGEVLYVASTAEASNTVSAFAIDPDDGSLSPLGSAISAGGENPRGLAVHPSGKFVYAAVLYANAVAAFSRVGDTFSLVGSFAAGEMPTSTAVDPSGKFLYVTNALGHSLSIFDIDAATGALSPRGQPFALPAGYFPLSMAIVEKK